MISYFPKEALVQEKYYLYYDETNNVRKLYLREEGTNTKFEHNFVLGGLASSKEIEINKKDLFDILGIQSNATEIKSKHIYQGDFLTSIGSKKLNIFLKWLDSSEFSIHFINKNLLYFSLVDIVDSLDNSNESENSIKYMKNHLYDLVKENTEVFFEAFYTYGYPNIKRERLVDFFEKLSCLIKQYNTKKSQYLNKIVIAIENKEYDRELNFIMENEDYMLIENFVPAYSSRIEVFNNSVHCFDNEENIKNKLEGTTTNRRYSFEESKDNIYIQVSDIIVGILGKFLTYVSNNDLKTLKTNLKTFNSIQKENSKLLSNVILNSVKKEEKLIANVTSFDDYEKFSQLLNKMKNH